MGRLALAGIAWLGLAGGPGGEPSAPSAPRPSAAEAPRAWAGEPAGAPSLVPLPGDFDAWAEWWQAQRREYFAPTPWAEIDGELGLDGEEGQPAGAALEGQLRSRAGALALAALGAPSALLRRAGLIATARLGGPDAVERIAPLADDGDREVRQAALLALATAGGEGARTRLLALAGTEKPRPEAALETGTALIALGLLRQGTVDTRCDELVEARLSAAAGLPPELASGAVLHAKLARAEACYPAVRVVAADEHVQSPVRALAMETLALSRDARDLEFLSSLLAHRDADLRRSAALALGAARDPRATDALLAAVTEERNLAARGFLVLSLGKLATQGAVERLLIERQRASSLDRAWAWLALGLSARAGDKRARAALELSADARLQAGERAAALVAIGLARQTAAFEFSARASTSTPEPIEAPYAADGLALTATAAAREALVAGLERAGENSRARYAEGLARMRHAADSPALVAAWQRTATAGARREVGLALGRHGSRETIAALLAVAGDPKSPVADRATALESASMALSRKPLDRLRALTADANVLALEPWILELANSGL
jgi:hypothetical protein